MTEEAARGKKKVLTVGFIGCGEIAHAHARAVEEADNARIAYAVDVNL